MLLPLLLAYTSTQAYFSTTGEDLEAVVVGEIDAATESVHVAIYTFTLPNVAGALASAADRGVEVEVVVDERQTFEAAGMRDVLDNLACPQDEDDLSLIPVRLSDGCGIAEDACGKCVDPDECDLTMGVRDHARQGRRGGTILTGSFN